MPRTELYIGNLNRDVSKKDIESVFEKYGRLLRCDLKDKGIQVYAFLEFEDSRDAEDALEAENGKDMCGSSMVVEFAKGKDRDRGRYGDRDRYGGRGGGYRGSGSSSGCYECGERGHFARDCRNKRSSGRSSGSYRDSRSDRDRRDDRRDRDRDRRDSRRRSRSHSRQRSRSRSRSYDRSRNID